jgi:hypothetical protein
MKYLRLVLCLSAFAFLSTAMVASADCCSSSSPEELTITKAGDNTAKIMMDSKTYCAPITFADGASWDSVKDSYTVSGAFSEVIEHGKVGITIAADGTASFNVIKHASKCSKKSCGKK